MNRLVQGDVGSGKTIVAFRRVRPRWRTVIRLHSWLDEILAEQHARKAIALFQETGHRIGCSREVCRLRKKRKVHEAIRTGEVQRVIGTHAIISGCR